MILLMMSITIIFSCDYCKTMYGEENLGSRFSLIRETENRVYILYCTSETCCSSGLHIIPSKVVESAFDDRWIIAKSIEKDDIDLQHFWIVDKSNAIDIRSCRGEACDSVINANVHGPLTNTEFEMQKKLLDISLSF